MEETRINSDKNCIEITKLTDRKIVVKEVEFRKGRIYMRAHVRMLRRKQ